MEHGKNAPFVNKTKQEEDLDSTLSIDDVGDSQGTNQEGDQQHQQVRLGVHSLIQQPQKCHAHAITERAELVGRDTHPHAAKSQNKEHTATLLAPPRKKSQSLQQVPLSLIKTPEQAALEAVVMARTNVASLVKWIEKQAQSGDELGDVEQTWHSYYNRVSLEVLPQAAESVMMELNAYLHLRLKAVAVTIQWLSRDLNDQQGITKAYFAECNKERQGWQAKHAHRPQHKAKIATEGVST